MSAFIPILAVLGYSLTSFVKKWEDGQEWDWVKFLTTMIVGGIVGYVARATPLGEITEGFVVAQLGMYSGLAMLIENLLKIIWRVKKIKDRIGKVI